MKSPASQIHCNIYKDYFLTRKISQNSQSDTQKKTQLKTREQVNQQLLITQFENKVQNFIDDIQSERL